MSIQPVLSGRRYLVGLLALALFFVLPGCDSAGGGDDTLVLNDPGVNPTVAKFEFEYDEGDFEDGIVTVTSNEKDQLSDVLDAYGYTRSDVVSVQVEEVRLERLSTPEVSAKQESKVFEYLTRAEVYMGTSTEAPLIGTAEPVPFNQEITLKLEDQNVTEQVKSEPTEALLQLFVEDASDIGSGGDRVEVDVEFRIEVRE